MENVYLCEYVRNGECAKTNCFYETIDTEGGCICTRKLEYALKDRKGEPIRASAELEKRIKKRYVKQYEKMLDRAVEKFIKERTFGE